MDIGRHFAQWMPFFAGKLWVAFCVRKFGSQGQLLGGSPMFSPTAGQSLGITQYLVAGIATFVGSKLAGTSKLLSATEFQRGCFDFIFTKLLWTEGIARSEVAQGYFGATPSYQPRTGQTWLTRGNRSVAMQGFGDELVQRSPLDGALGDELVHRSPLDGDINYRAYTREGDPFRASYNV